MRLVASLARLGSEPLLSDCSFGNRGLSSSGSRTSFGQLPVPDGLSRDWTEFSEEEKEKVEQAIIRKRRSTC